MDRQTLINLANYPHLSGERERKALEELVKEYPFFHAAWLLLARADASNPDALTSAAARCPYRSVIRRVMLSQPALPPTKKHALEHLTIAPDSINTLDRLSSDEPLTGQQVSTPSGPETYSSPSWEDDSWKKASDEPISFQEVGRTDDDFFSEPDSETETWSEPEEHIRASAHITATTADAADDYTTRADEMLPPLQPQAEAPQEWEPTERPRLSLFTSTPEDEQKAADIIGQLNAANSPFPETTYDYPEYESSFEEPVFAQSSSSEPEPSPPAFVQPEERMEREYATVPTYEPHAPEVTLELEPEPDFFALNDLLFAEEAHTEPSLTILPSPTRPHMYSEEEKISQSVLDQETQRRIIDEFMKNEPSLKIQMPPAESLAHLEHKDLVNDQLSRFKFSVTENLAQILRRQGRIERAIDIYERLMLKYPEKKTYFAEQIDLLKKEI